MSDFSFPRGLPGYIHEVENIRMTGTQPVREPTLVIINSRLRELIDRVSVLSDRVLAAADMYTGSIPHPGNEIGGLTKKVESPGLISNIEANIETLVTRMLILEKQYDRLMSGL